VSNAGAKQITISTYKAKPDNLKRMIKAFPDKEELWRELYIDKGERLHSYIYLPQQTRYRYISELKTIVEEQGLGFTTCREGFPQLNTENYICDGTTPLRNFK